jgi:hypothetical protein
MRFLYRMKGQAREKRTVRRQLSIVHIVKRNNVRPCLVQCCHRSQPQGPPKKWNGIAI